MVELHVPTDRKSTRLNSSHLGISYAVFCLKKKKTPIRPIFRYCACSGAYESFAKDLDTRRPQQCQRVTWAGGFLISFFFKKSGTHRDLLSFPTRRSPD